MAYTKTNWVNDSVPAINATNLNKIEQGIYEAHENIGNLSSLDTTNKENLVNAINEVNTKATDFSYCEMKTNFDLLIVTSITQINGWESPNNYGDFIADTQNNRLIISNAEVIELNGLISGNGSATVQYRLVDNENNEVEGTSARQMIYNFGENYWQLPLSNKVYVLDKTKTYYIYLFVGGYNTSFYINNGFSKNGTWISAKKLK